MEEKDEKVFTSPEEDTEKQYGSLRHKIDNLNYSDKLQLALTGSWSERSILIRDKNRALAASVLKSPKLSEQEVVMISQMRDVDVEILREISNNRQWKKSYSVILNLTTNPKTPIAIALTLIPRLMARDLKILKLNKNISEAVSRKAGQQLAIKMGGKKTGG